MKKNIQHIFKFIPLIFLYFLPGFLSSTQIENSLTIHQPTQEDAKPLVYWYWNDAAVSRTGITTDLEAMKEAGLEGAYLFFIRGASDRVKFDKPVEQLTPEWWEMVKFTFEEANRLNLKLGLHSCDGFTAAGGPWITPELSMQKLVWTDTIVSGGTVFNGKLPQPETLENYYRDIKAFALPAKGNTSISSYILNPKITSSIPGENPDYLNDPATPERFRSEIPCWIQYEFERPFTCRSVVVKMPGSSFQAGRLILEVSDDGQHFKKQTRLKPHRQGWMDEEQDITFSIEPVEARFFRFVYNPKGTEPGAEDLDAAKWKQSLKIAGIELSSSPKINQFEGKNGSIWRISNQTTTNQVPDSSCIPSEKIIDISSFMNDEGVLHWNVPPGRWKILRMGHTSTGKTNYVGGGGLGLECDKLNSEVAAFQFDKWLGEFYRQIGVENMADVLKYFHVDSWECGSQNWSPVFTEEFMKRRGYDLIPLLPVMAGIPIDSASFSEKVLHDVRRTISELVADNFYATFQRLAHEKGLQFSAESVAPVMVSDGMLHMKNVDIPMGEFWLNSPTHDKPNDILDAISAGHIYGKRIIQSESFTEIRMDWNEHPGMLKTLGDRNFALGINRMAFHVFSHNPWADRKPGMTLGVVGLFFQPAQTWFQPGKAWVNYIRNCQGLLQQGVSVNDIAVFTGEEIPRRAILPERLVSVFPEIFGEDVVKNEKIRLENEGQPTHERPRGVTSSTNIADPADWVDPLKGYAYDSFNRDALLNFSKVNNGRIELPGGASYALLVVPGKRKMNPEAALSIESAKQILTLIKNGASVYFQEKPEILFGSNGENREFDTIINELFSDENSSMITAKLKVKKIGKGRVITGIYDVASFAPLGIEKDFYALDADGRQAVKIAWTHRIADEKEIYFVSNQNDEIRNLELSFRVSGKIPELYFPVTDTKTECKQWRMENGRTIIPCRFENNESFFVVFEKETSELKSEKGKNRPEFESVKKLEDNWEVEFDPSFGGPENPVHFDKLTDWSKNENDKIKYYSGTAIYQRRFDWEQEIAADHPVWIELGEVNNLAEVTVNGVNCGILWTAPFRLDISKALKKGKNELEISVTNTWANRLIGDKSLPEEKQTTWTTADYRLEGQSLLPAGLSGPVKILKEK